MEVVPKNFQLVFPAELVKKRIEELGAAMTQYAEEVWRESHTDLLVIPILRGGVFFFVHLVQAIGHSVEIAPARAWGYEGNTMTADLRLSVADIPARGRAVVLVDDICDSGRTLQEIKSALLESGARTVRSAVLVKRVIAGPSVEPDWVGFSYQGDDWLVGWGMDDGERFRNLRSIYVIRQQSNGSI